MWYMGCWHIILTTYTTYLVKLRKLCFVLSLAKMTVYAGLGSFVVARLKQDCRGTLAILHWLKNS
jgi:hypothetical protein